LLPVNLYAPGDSFDPRRAHVIPALIKKCLDKKCLDAIASSGPEIVVARTPLEDGLRQTVEWCRQRRADLRPGDGRSVASR